MYGHFWIRSLLKKRVSDAFCGKGCRGVSREREEKKQPVSEAELSRITAALASIDYGSVLISVQDGKIVQIDKNEKFRLK